jgi:hypothetical protein
MLFFTGDDFSVFPSVPAAEQSEQHAHQLFTRGQAQLALFDGAFQNTIGLGYTYYRTKIQEPDTGFGLPPANLNHGDRLKFDWLGKITMTEHYPCCLSRRSKRRLLDSPISAENATWPALPSAGGNPARAFAAASIVMTKTNASAGKRRGNRPAI